MGKNIKLSKKEEDLLIKTPIREYRKVFPNHSIDFLKNEKFRIRKELGITSKNSVIFKNPKLTKEEENYLLMTTLRDAVKKFPEHSANFLKNEKARIRKERGIKERTNTSPNPPLTVEQQDLLLITKDTYEFKELFPNHSVDFLKNEKRRLKNERGLDKFGKPINTTTEQDLLYKDKEEKIQNYAKKNKELLKEIAALKKENDAFLFIQENAHASKPIELKPSSHKTECAIVLQLSDWHWEEKVNPAQVNGLNHFNLDIADRRVNQYCETSLNIINTIKNPYNVRKLVIAIQGDFISGNIHEELMENNMLEPSFAIIEAQKKLISLIEFYLQHTDFEEILIVPSSGNHGRMSKKQKISTELGNSLEHYMYYVLENYFKDNERINFIAQTAYHTFVNILGTMVRFHHGHFMRFWGAVGGITTSVNKSVSQWNKSLKADLDVFGHFHQTTRMKNFICNGSLIGYNPFAVSIKAEYEPPSQNLFVIDSMRGQTLFTPIVLD